MRFVSLWNVAQKKTKHFCFLKFASFREVTVDLYFFFQPLPELDPTISTPVRAPPTEMSRGDDEDDDDEDIEETSGQGVEMTTARGTEKKTT